jgi:hypothetical protein
MDKTEIVENIAVNNPEHSGFTALRPQQVSLRNVPVVRLESQGGERLRCKTETAQINEALCKVLCDNLCVVIQSMY